MMPNWPTSWLRCSPLTSRPQQAVLDLRVRLVKTVVLEDQAPLESPVCLDRMVEKDPEDPWALKVKREHEERKESPVLVSEENKDLLAL